MKSIHIACAAIAATGVTLGAVALLGNPDRVIGAGYDHMLAAAEGRTRQALAAAAHAPGSEHFWLTRQAASASSIKPTLAVTSGISQADIKQAVATAGGVEADHLEILNVQDIARATVGGPASVGQALLVTARIEATSQQPARIVRFVLDAAQPQAAGRAL